MRLAFVIQRYGLEVNGGAELHCRWLAERLARRHQVEVFATRALDYLEWRNHYPAGTERVNGIPVHRFPVKRTRNARAFASLSNLCFHESHTREEEEAWVRENGPFSPALVKAVARSRDRFDRILFYCFRYYHSYHGLPTVRDRALLVPTAEEDPAVQLGIMKPFFSLPRGIVYLTPEEQALVEDASGNRSVPSTVIGSGLNLPEADPTIDFRAKHGLTRPFVLYVGRIDKNKGCVTLFAYFRKFREETGADVDLVLAGRSVVPIPDDPHVRHVGFITEEEKVAALGQCALLVMPSRVREPVGRHARGLEARCPGARERPVQGPDGAVPALERGALLPRVRGVRGGPAAAAGRSRARRPPRPAGPGVRRARVLVGDDRREDGRPLRADERVQGLIPRIAAVRRIEI